MMRKSRAFTLIELLVVIAIIGILAAMVFPVFARARESARRAVCLSNVKNIALAIQMYLADNNDTLPSRESNSQALAYFDTAPGGEEYPSPANICATWANPYMRWPVILDEYVRNREVWQCPSAKALGGAAFIVPGPDWLTYMQLYEGTWGAAGGYNWKTCNSTWPVGWGGTVTDTLAQQQYAILVAEGGGAGGVDRVFVQTISTGEEASAGMKLAQVIDATNYAICADGGVQTKTLHAGSTAYPDICCTECAGINWYAWGWPYVPDPATGVVECPSASDPCCGTVAFNMRAKFDWITNPDRMRASARHLGGVNVGFLDGHASWMLSPRLLTLVGDQEIKGLQAFCSFGGGRESYEAICGTPPDHAVFLW